jgi:hypothetical protein
MKDMLILVRCKRLYKKQAEQFKPLSFSICLATFNRQPTPEMSRALRPLMIRGFLFARRFHPLVRRPLPADSAGLVKELLLAGLH